MILTRAHAEQRSPPPSPIKGLSQLPSPPFSSSYAVDTDIHMNTVKNTIKDIHMQTVRNAIAGLPFPSSNTLNDVKMETSKAGGTTVRNKFQLWELELLETPEVKRKATVAQLCMFVFVESSLYIS